MRLRGKQLDAINAALKSGTAEDFNAALQKTCAQAEGIGQFAAAPGSTAPSVVALTKWMHEVTALLCYQPEVPLKHKEDLCAAMNEYDQVRRAEELTKR